MKFTIVTAFLILVIVSIIIVHRFSLFQNFFLNQTSSVLSARDNSDNRGKSLNQDSSRPESCDINKICDETFGQNKIKCIAKAIAHGCQNLPNSDTNHDDGLIPSPTSVLSPTQLPSNNDFSQISPEQPLVKNQWEQDVTIVIHSILDKNPLLRPILDLIPSPTQTQNLIKIQNSTEEQPVRDENSSGISLPQINAHINPEIKKSDSQEPQIEMSGQPQVRKAGHYFSIFEFVIKVNNIIASFVNNLIISKR